MPFHNGKLVTALVTLPNVPMLPVARLLSRGNPSACSAFGLPPSHCSKLFKIVLCRDYHSHHAATLCWLECVLDQSTWVLLACTQFAYDLQSYVSCSCATPVAHCYPWPIVRDDPSHCLSRRRAHLFFSFSMLIRYSMRARSFVHLCALRTNVAVVVSR